MQFKRWHLLRMSVSYQKFQNAAQELIAIVQETYPEFNHKVLSAEDESAYALRKTTIDVMDIDRRAIFTLEGMNLAAWERSKHVELIIKDLRMPKYAMITLSVDRLSAAHTLVVYSHRISNTLEKRIWQKFGQATFLHRVSDAVFF